MDAGVGERAEITIEWGGKDGPSVSGSVAGRVSDDDGNKVEVGNDGSGKVIISAEREEKSNS